MSNLIKTGPDLFEIIELMTYRQTDSRMKIIPVKNSVFGPGKNQTFFTNTIRSILHIKHLPNLFQKILIFCKTLASLLSDRFLRFWASNDR